MKKKARFLMLLGLGIVLAGLLAMVSFAEDPAAAAVGTAKVTYDVVNVRLGPGTNYAKVGQMTKGTLVPILDYTPNHKFIKVSFEGAVRYVHQNSIVFVPTQPTQPTVPTVKPPAVKPPTATDVIGRVTVIVDKLNVRLGPGKKYAVCGQLTAGTVVPVIQYDASNGYAKISYQGDVRYAHIADYTRNFVVDNSPEPVLANVTVTANVLNVRTGPGTSYPIVGKLTGGTSVPVMCYNTYGGFAKISYQGDVRYVSAKYLK
ncbi:MAG: SH3 domain-containing protein [Ruthenibacterium sp.]